MNYNFGTNLQQYSPNYNQQNPFSNLALPANSPFNFSLQQDQSLIAKIKNLGLPNLQVFSQQDIVSFFGADISGIDICVTNGPKILAIKQNTNTKPIGLREMCHFIYCCNSIEKSKQIQVMKIAICNVQLENPTNTAINRNSVICQIDPNVQKLIDDTVNFVKSVFQ